MGNDGSRGPMGLGVSSDAGIYRDERDEGLERDLLFRLSRSYPMVSISRWEKGDW
jgi:hypothetical protein